MTDETVVAASGFARRIGVKPRAVGLSGDLLVVGP